MKEFFVGLLTIAVLLVLMIVGIFLLPFIIVLGFVLKSVITFAFILFAIWLIGWVTLKAIDRGRKGKTDWY